LSGKVTAIAGQVPDPVTPEVTPEAAAPAPAVTPSTWKEVMGDCIQARQEVLGVLAGLDPGIPPPVRFPQTEAYIGVSIDYLRKSVSALDAAIASIQTELPEVRG
jgi:hypothetical protein